MGKLDGRKDAAEPDQSRGSGPSFPERGQVVRRGPGLRRRDAPTRGPGDPADTRQPGRSRVSQGAPRYAKAPGLGNVTPLHGSRPGALQSSSSSPGPSTRSPHVNDAWIADRM